MRGYKKSKLRKNEILETAKDLFSKQGFRNTTIEDIATADSIARTTMYDYYKSKEEILYALIDEIVEQPRENLPEGTVKSQLEILAADSIARILNNFSLYKILFQEMPTLEKQTADKIQSWQNQSMALVKQVIMRGLAEGDFKTNWKAEDIVFTFRALIGQKLADLLLSETRVQPEEEARHLIGLMWSGVGSAD
jgi:AcrR family transcriptional regulator